MLHLLPAPREKLFSTIERCSDAYYVNCFVKVATSSRFQGKSGAIRLFRGSPEPYQGAS